MKCPIDQTVLTISDRNGIEIDFCGQCRGVWLDRGELDKIIDRDTPSTNNYQTQRRSEERYEERRREDDYRGRDDGDRYYSGKKKKRESFLGDLFDF